MKKIFGAAVPLQSRAEAVGALDSEDGLPRESLEQWAYLMVHETSLRTYTAKVVGRADGPGPRVVFNGALWKMHGVLKKGPVDHVRSYFMRVVRNEAVDYWRQLARKRLYEVSVGDDVSLLDRADPAGAVGELAADERSQMKRYCERLRPELTEKEMTAFCLMQIDGLSAQEVAAAMSETGQVMSAGNVRVTVHRARRKLSKQDALARLGLVVAE